MTSGKGAPNGRVAKENIGTIVLGGQRAIKEVWRQGLITWPIVFG